jgi:hypothetical protein
VHPEQAALVKVGGPGASGKQTAHHAASPGPLASWPRATAQLIIDQVVLGVA